MAGKRKFFLGKGGNIFGPYPAEKLDELRLTGEILNYSYLWDEDRNEWIHLDPMPRKPGSSVEEPSPRRSADTQLEKVDAICHDNNSVVAGKLRNVTDMGCDLLSKNHTGPPELALETALILNVLNPRNNKAVNIKAALYNVTHDEQGWIYHLRWAHRPSF